MCNKSKTKRVIILVAGVTMNFITAIVVNISNRTTIFHITVFGKNTRIIITPIIIAINSIMLTKVDDSFFSSLAAGHFPMPFSDQPDDSDSFQVWRIHFLFGQSNGISYLPGETVCLPCASSVH